MFPSILPPPASPCLLAFCHYLCPHTYRNLMTFFPEWSLLLCSYSSSGHSSELFPLTSSPESIFCRCSQDYMLVKHWEQAYWQGTISSDCHESPSWAANSKLGLKKWWVSKTIIQLAAELSSRTHKISEQWGLVDSRKTGNSSSGAWTGPDWSIGFDQNGIPCPQHSWHLRQSLLCSESCLCILCRVFGIVPSLYPQDVSNMSSLVVTTKNVPSHCQMSPRK